MGRPMAGQLIRGGHAVFLHSRRGVPQELLEQGGKACSSSKEVAQNADAIITMLPDTPDVERALRSGNQVGSPSGGGQGPAERLVRTDQRSQAGRKNARIVRRAGSKRLGEVYRVSRTQPKAVNPMTKAAPRSQSANRRPDSSGRPLAGTNDIRRLRLHPGHALKCKPPSRSESNRGDDRGQGIRA